MSIRLDNFVAYCSMLPTNSLSMYNMMGIGTWNDHVFVANSCYANLISILVLHCFYKTGLASWNKVLLKPITVITDVYELIQAKAV